MKRIILRRFLSWLVTVAIFSAACRASEFDHRLGSISARSFVGTNDNILVAGFVIGPGAKKTVLIRAVGPTLGQFGVSTPLATPVLKLFNSSSVMIASNSGWSSDPAMATQLSAAFSATGAFTLPQGSSDAALLTTLDPGVYTAQVEGMGTSTGNAMVEVYDLNGSARLISLSARAQVQSDQAVLIGGISVAGGETRHLLVRAVGPTLAQFGVSPVLADPSLDIYDVSGNLVASNDDWGTAAGASTFPTVFTQAGAFPLPQGSKDAALLVDLTPGLYTAYVKGKPGMSGVAICEFYDLTPEYFSTVSVSASIASTSPGSTLPAMVIVSRSGNANDALTVPISIGGTAVPGVDYTALPSQVTFPPGGVSQGYFITASTTAAPSSTPKTVTVSIPSGTGYGLGDSSSATVRIFYGPGQLYFATLRPVAGASGSSVASGTATILLSPDQTYATVNVSFANLSSTEVVAHLAVGGPSDQGPYVLGLPSGQVTDTRWDFMPSGTYGTADLIQALQNGQIYVSIDSANFPSGELRGQFILSTGSTAFVAPAPPPPLVDAPMTSAQASRFLQQATFGPTQADVDALTGKKLADLDAWITAQMALPATPNRAATLADWQTYGGGNNMNTAPSTTNRQYAWWKVSVTAPDQLRQRVAFALSELFVVSDQNSTLNNNQEGLAAYYDLLANDAFGNFRQVLQDVAMSPVMGVYLSHLRNQKANPKTGTHPDENFAREVMQLFSIGLVQLQPDGTLKLDSTGQPIPTYDNTTITETARVFTGFSFYTATPTTTSFTGGKADYIDPMTLFPAYHDDGSKTIVTGRVLPAGQGGIKDVSDTLDTLFDHPNTGPFVARRLIERLVTSNPSPAYVYRVAQVFADNGKGVRGDLAAVVRAILMDYEARSPEIASAVGFGKLKEPLLRETAVLRAFNGSAGNGRYPIGNAYNLLGESPLGSLTVFNFFDPDYVLPGSLAAAGLDAPEYQILTDTTAISVPNFLYGSIYANRSTTTVGLDLTSLLPLAATPADLVDKLSTLLCGGSLSQTARTRIIAALNAMPASTSATERVRSTIYLLTASPFGAIQK